MSPFQDWTQYINKLLAEKRFKDLKKARLSIVLTGSTSIGFEDSDWDFKLLYTGHGARLFLDTHGPKFHVDDKVHNPETFVLFRPLSFLDREFSEDLSIGLWIYGNAIVLRDDDEQFTKKLKEAKLLFERSLQSSIDTKYLRLRCIRHSVAGAQKRDDEIATKLLLVEGVGNAMQLLHLIHGKPYPYSQWLRWSFENSFSDIYPELTSQIGNSLNSDLSIAIPSLKEVTESIITIMVNMGHSETHLREWWQNI